MISKEDFAAWKDNPITQAVMAWVKAHAAESKKEWDAKSWEQGNPDPVLLAELRARAQVAEDFAAVELSDIQEDSDAESVRPDAA